MTALASPEPATTFPSELARFRRIGPLAHDLARWSPAECGLPGVPDPVPGDEAAPARAAVARYLAGHDARISPDQVMLAGSPGAALARTLAALLPGEGAVLAPAGAARLPGDPAWPAGREVIPVPLRYDGAWRLDEKALRRAVTPRVRAVLLGRPAHPTGAVLREEETDLVESLCAEHGLLLLADERLLDTAVDATPSLAARRRVLTVHLSGLPTVSGRAGGPGWAALAGPEPLVTRALRRLEAEAPAADPGWSQALRELPALLDGREAFLGPLRRRLASNRSHLEVASLREAPWSVLESGGGWAGLLQIGSAWRAEAVALRLLEEGVVVQPGGLDGLPGDGVLILSLLTDPVAFDLGLERLERRLRGGDAP